ncbi:MAG: hypothetical protein JXK16_10180 [Thiotrichales bacterium]|nr:hypothetical protein [Thiotrichales bacterium]
MLTRIIATIVFFSMFYVATQLPAMFGKTKATAEVQAQHQLCVKGVLYFGQTLTPIYDKNSSSPIICEEVK